ncbi:alkaline phosphatase family protein [Coccidioides posadasii C735 delta SOWgp]|uniref:Alkaline phosphatase family protein n=1 Tax=Coccidioides posadasii (strain C735) TaxID=222929 RepID=C5PA41_COCP7|nr:alkaline phosphatase family protein [Coccidioides posadasii C735 delta SOWgp]EER26603.1 alkaline phosphatase family protein [Coccidioides posadasii C735 delta SOWgp]|eukprot:XP_003068748.1 alkaline phosphatase family protein [Coccidioides posadasii C735 delta SOWgp]
MRYSLGLLALSAATASASFVGNLNYRSPSANHPSLGVSVPKVEKRSEPGSAFDPAQLNFTHGVASGDPYATSVILWTRCSPMFDDVNDNSTVSGLVPMYNPVPIYKDTDEHRPISNAPVCLRFKVATDDKLKRVVDEGTVYTSSDVDYTVKASTVIPMNQHRRPLILVEATKLKPFITYYYQFSVCGSNKKSPIGRTKTAPKASRSVDRINLAVFSCSNYPFGFFNAYGNVARKDSVDYVLHLGGSGKDIGRLSLPDRTIYTLYDYRKRLATYRTDLDLQANHQNFAWIPVWDDHEVADNSYRDGSSELNNTEASFITSGGISVDQRKMNAVRAYFEWMPIRQVDMDDNLRIWRNFQLGSLVDVIMLDTRNYDRSITNLYWNKDYVDQLKNEPNRSLMGSKQENWLYRNLIQSAKRGAKWRIIGSQIVFSYIDESAAFGDNRAFNLDAWNGYQANRNRTFKTLFDNKIDNNILIAGDSHANWVSDLVWLGQKEYDPATGAGAIGVEFGGSAVTSSSPAGRNIDIKDSINASKALVTTNPVLQWSELYYRGYFELHITPKEVDARFFGTPKLRVRNPGEISLANFTVKSGANRLDRGPVGVPAGGIVENGWLKGGKVVQTNVTNSTDTGRWYISN